MATALLLTGIALCYLLIATHHEETVRAYGYALVRYAIVFNILLDRATWSDLRNTRKFRERRSVQALEILNEMTFSGYRRRYAQLHAHEPYRRLFVLWTAGTDVCLFDPVGTEFVMTKNDSDRRTVTVEEAVYALVTRAPWAEPVITAREAVRRMRHLFAYGDRSGYESA
jgi:hypothetical protein